MDYVDDLNLKLGIGPRRPPLPAELVQKGFKSIKQVGKGAFGMAILIFDENRERYSIAKEIVLTTMSSKQKAEAQNEIDILSSLSHPNIIRYEECFVSRDKVIIVMEYADGGDLGAKIKAKQAMSTPFRQAEAARIFGQTALALRYLHEKKILHRDLKAQNVFLTKANVVKLGDFGISTVLRNSVMMAQTICGTPYYFSPELCQGQAYNNKSDIWALGCLLYEILSLDVPFRGTSMTDLMKSIVSRDPAPLPGHCDARWRTLVDSLLRKDPDLRPSIHEVLRDSFLREQFGVLASEFEHCDNSPRSDRSPRSSPQGSPSPKSHGQMLKQQLQSNSTKREPQLPPVAGRRATPVLHAPRPPTLEAYFGEGPQLGRRSPRNSLDNGRVALGRRADSSDVLVQPFVGLDAVIAAPNNSIMDQYQNVLEGRKVQDDGIGPKKNDLPDEWPEQPCNAHKESDEHLTIAALLKTAAEDREGPSPRRANDGWEDNWCSGVDLTSPDLKDLDGDVKVGNQVFSLSDKACSRQPRESTKEARLAAAQAMIEALTSDLEDEHRKNTRLHHQLGELRAKVFDLTEENLQLRKKTRTSS
ncbi:putative Protein kinase [Diplonema papillatum]|nr:putative Protein kinase [Diplonema papillatum]